MNVKRLFTGPFLVLFIILVIWLGIYYNLFYYLKHPDEAATLLLSFHPYDDFAFIFIQILQVLSGGMIPGALTEFIGGYLYGPVIGTIYSILGMSIGSFLAFMLSRKYGLSLVTKMVKPSTLDKYEHFMEERGPIVTLILFLIPGLPKSAFSYIIGLSKINVWTFLAVSTAGRLAGTILATLSGHWVKNEHIVLFLVLIVILLIVFLLVFFYRNYLVELIKRKK